MTRALVVTHSESESLGRLEEWLPAAGLDVVHCRPWAGDPVPATAAGHEALVVMGGPQQAYDDASAPWLRATKDLLAASVADGTAVLAVCLGGQLLAEACGGVVEPGERGPELGARLVAKRDVAGADPLVWDTPMSWICYQWHWDAITELPPGATLLASSPRYDHQMFRVGERAWGTQFHLEPDAAMLARWADRNGEGVREAGQDPDAVLERALAELDEVEDLWRPVVERFAAVARGEDPRPTQLPLV